MSRADLLRRLNAASATVAGELADAPPDPTRFMTAKELAYIKCQMAERYGLGSDPAQPYIDYLAGDHPMLDHPMYDHRADAVAEALTEQQCADLCQKMYQQPWWRGRRINRHG